MDTNKVTTFSSSNKDLGFVERNVIPFRIGVLKRFVLDAHNATARD